MTTPTITLYPDTLPAKGQANAAFDTNVDDFLTWQTVTNGPELAAMITWTQGVADTVLATALAGTLPSLTGKAGDYIRANAAEDGGEFRTVAEVLADIGGASAASVALKAPLASPPLTGVPTAPTAAAGTNTTQVATTAFVKGTSATSATTSGFEIDFTGIPDGVTDLEVWFDDVGLTSADNLIVQIGTGASPTTTGYESSSVLMSSNVRFKSSAGMALLRNAAAYRFFGSMELSLFGGNWVSKHIMKGEDVLGYPIGGGGGVTLAGDLNNVRITRASGTGTFTAGQIRIRYK
jgi:hypothetical protein